MIIVTNVTHFTFVFNVQIIWYKNKGKMYFILFANIVYVIENLRWTSQEYLKTYVLKVKELSQKCLNTCEKGKNVLTFSS